MNIPLRLAAILATVSAAVAPAPAQEVAVEGDRGKGQGYVFRYGNACWLVTAKHLIDEWGAFRITVPGSPPIAGEGTAYAPFWDGLDLAAGVVRGAAAGACTATLGDLDVAWTASTPAGQLRLPYVYEDGTVDRSTMRIIDVPDHKQFLAEFTDGAPAFDGRSGSFLTSSGRLAGMVATKPQTDTSGRTVDDAHGFIRIEEIAMNLRRYLETRGVSLAEAAEPVQSQQEAGYAIEVQDYSLEPAEIGTTAENVLVEGTPFLFTGTGRIVFRVADGSARDLRRVRIISDGAEAKPKDVTVDIDDDAEGPFVPIWFWSGTMDQSGVFDTGERAPRRMRRVAITVSSAWGGDPRRIDRVILY